MAFRGTPSILYAGTHDGLYRSANGGATWTACNRGLRSWNVLAVAADPAASATMYAATAAAIYKSVDGGQSWTELQKDLYVMTLAIDPRAPSTVYAATHMGVLKSVDAGDKWTALHLVGENPAATAGEPAASALPALPMGASKRGPAGTPRLPALPVGRSTGDGSKPQR